MPIGAFGPGRLLALCRRRGGVKLKVLGNLNVVWGWLRQPIKVLVPQYQYPSSIPQYQSTKEPSPAELVLSYYVYTKV